MYHLRNPLTLANLTGHIAHSDHTTTRNRHLPLCDAHYRVADDICRLASDLDADPHRLLNVMLAIR
jgi:hypothetical protein